LKTLKEHIAKTFAKVIVYKTRKWSKNPVETQKAVFKNLIKKGVNTFFGKDHNFKNILTHQDFIDNVPVRDYEELKPYFDKVIKGGKNIVWPGKPLYFAKTSGTTSGVKYIPITKDSMPTHVNGSRDAMLHYINETGKTFFK